MQKKIGGLLLLTIFFFACQTQKLEEYKDDLKLQTISAAQSGLDFSNNILENDTLNYFTFPYLYLGGGVAIGDINNDGLSDVYLTGNLLSNKLYLNKGNLQFEDISISAGVAGDDRWYTGVTMVDINADGWLDIYVCVGGKFATTKNQLFINNKDQTFTESASKYGLNDATASIQATFFDYDKDGLLDVFVGNYPIVPVSMGNEYYYKKMQANLKEESGHLYHNKGNQTFEEVTEQAGLQAFGLTLGVIAVDFNEDNWTDLYVSNDFNVPDYFYLNNQDGTFREVAKESMNNFSLFGMGIDAGDYNNDGLQDLLQVDMTPADHFRSKTNMASMSPRTFWQAIDLGLHYQYMQNSLQLNNGMQDDLPLFSNVARLSRVATTDWSWGALFLDMDQDGWKDIFITNGIKRDVNNNDANKKLEGGSFFGQSSKDYTILPSQPIANFAFQNKGDFTFQDKTEEWNLAHPSFSNGSSYGDLDNDGDLDLVINNIDEPVSLVENKANLTHPHFIRIKLAGPKNNPLGLGSKIMLYHDDNQQIQELTLSRGFQSSVEPILHFGLGNTLVIDQVKIIWPDGKQQLLKGVNANQLLYLDYVNAAISEQHKKEQVSIFEDITQRVGIDFVHQENLYNDFQKEPLLPHKNSQMGPGLAVGDVNGDGLEDFFIGNAKGSAAAMYLQSANGQFRPIAGPWESDKQFEDGHAILADLDKDGDLDLYVVNGGNNDQEAPAFYQDRLYLNTKNGFIKGRLPKITTSGLVVQPGDFDRDGDLDLFIGGRLVPNKYPLPAKSYILQNNGGQNEQLNFSDVTASVAPELEKAGLVTAALWDDFDEDGLLDLIIMGEWMPIRFFKNNGTTFEEWTQKLGVGEDIGWWYSLQKADIDQDGDMDYIAGNLGLNYKYRATTKTPFELYANDFDENQHLDIVLGYEKKGKKIPLRGRECSSEQVPAIQKRFVTYESFANASLSDIYGQGMLENSLQYKATTFAHCWIEHKGNMDFTFHPLPQLSQFSSINAITVFDYNHDAYPDFLIGGNLFGSEVETPRNDASFGLVLTGKKDGLQAIPPAESGLVFKGEVKNLSLIRLGKNKQRGVLMARNNGALKLISIGSN